VIGTSSAEKNRMDLSKVTSDSDFRFLDQDDFLEAYEFGRSSQGRSMRFLVQGMSCSKCVQKIESLAGRMEGLQNLRVSLDSGVVEAMVSRDSGSFAGVARAIRNLGFKVSPLMATDEENSFQKQQERSELVRLGVAGFCASNIMMFSFAIYAGAGAEFEKIFSWLAFGLYLPIVSFVAMPFYQGAVRALRQRALSIDLPLAIASVAGFLFSTINLIRGHGSIYFDSLSGFLFLILISRFFQRKLQRSSLKIDHMTSLESLSRARKWDGIGWTWQLTSMLKVGDTVCLKRGDLVPVDGRVKSDRVVIDTSLLTGESHPRLLMTGMKIPAGALLKNLEALVEVETIGVETDFGKLLRTLRENSLKQSQVQNLSDRWSQVLIKTVFAIAIFFLVGYWFVSPEQALERSLALIILACPCAMAFGTPLALAFSLKSAATKGFVLRSADAFEKALNIKNVFIDKTGTLTHRSMRVKKMVPAAIPSDIRQIVLGLELNSYHPIAEGLREYVEGIQFENGSQVGSVEFVEEIPGLGVQGFCEGIRYEIRSSESITHEKSVALYKQGVPVVHFYFEDSLIPGARELIGDLSRRGLQTYLLSGDQRQFAESLGLSLGIEKDHIYFEKTPSEKAALVAERPGSLMIGDGANDTTAFQAATLGIAVKGSVELALKTADVYFISDRLENIPQLFEISERAHSLIRQNLLISLAYNVLAGTGALLGLVHPLVAAVLMPISSGFILLHTWWRTRA
jgi:Cu2+-exporting ATPase/Cu+-exporting ATPase